MHNLTYYQRLLADARRAIDEGRYLEFFAAAMRSLALDAGESPGEE